MVDSINLSTVDTKINGVRAKNGEESFHLDPEHMRVQYVDRWLIDLWSNGNGEVAKLCLDKHFFDHRPTPYFPNTMEGHVAMCLDWVQAFSKDSKFVCDDFIIMGNKSVGRYTFTGTHIGKLAGIEPTNKLVTLTGIDIMAYNHDGLITEWWHNEDWAGLMEQLGQK